MSARRKTTWRRRAAFEGLADYLVINVGSPDTPGLRALQTVEALQLIVEPVSALVRAWRAPPPLLLKLARRCAATTCVRSWKRARPGVSAAGC